MYSKVGKGITILLLVIFLFAHSSRIAKANNNTDENTTGEQNALTVLTAQPEQCVTLREGRSCFASIHLHWKTPLKYSLCLFKEGQKKQIKCWKNNDSADITIDFESNNSTTYQLRNMDNNKVIAQTQIKVSWLHKSSTRKRRWRLF